MNNESLSQRQRQLRNLVVMALADGSIGEREVNLVADRCEQLGLNEDDLHHAMKFGLGDDAALEFPEAAAERETLMKDLIRMMAADGYLAETEKRLFALAAVRMSLSPQDVDRLIAETLPGGSQSKRTGR